jgi:transcriptional regulator with XRE-family HTH domain
MTAVKAHATFGYRLARERNTRGWTLRQAGDKAGMSWMTVRRAENGRPVFLATAIALARVYGTTVDALLNAEPPP